MLRTLTRNLSAEQTCEGARWVTVSVCDVGDQPTSTPRVSTTSAKQQRRTLLGTCYSEAERMTVDSIGRRLSETGGDA